MRRATTSRADLLRLAARVVFWLVLAYIAFVTLSPIDFRPLTPFPPWFERFAAFVILSGLGTVAYPARPLRWMIVLILVAAGLEASQNLVGGRHGRLIDFEVKTAGILFGTLAGILVGRIAGRREAPLL